VRAEFTQPDQEDQVVGTATWDGSRVKVQAEDEDVAAALWRVFRPTAVAIDDPALRTAGTTGPVVLPPGSLRWFQAAAEARSEAENLSVRFVPEGGGAIGWDPAGAYRPFSEAIESMQRSRATASGR
jgi:hypothetical protein